MSNYEWNDREDGWNGDHWRCDCGAVTSGPGERLCGPCRNAGEALPADIPCCDRCGAPALVRILTREGALCQPCGVPFLAEQRRKALAKGEREHARNMERVFRGSRVAAMQEE